MMYSDTYPSDINFLDSIDAYLNKIGAGGVTNPQERLALYEQARNTLYSYDVQMIGRVAEKILKADMETDTEAKALMIALYNHSLDPAFIQILTQYLEQRRDSRLNGLVGAVLTRVLDQYVREHYDMTKDKKDKKESKESAEIPKFDEINHIQIAIEQLLGPTADRVSVTCGNLKHTEALFIASCIAMESTASILELVNSELPITAKIFDGLDNPGNIIYAALTLKKADLPTKLSANQTAFLDSLKQFVYQKLERFNGGTTPLYSYLVAVYGSVRPDVSPYWLQIKDCGTQYTNLLTVAKQIVNK